MHDRDWYLLHTRPRQEEVAAGHLERQGYGVYLPRLRLPKLRRHRWHDAIEPLFARYLFVGVVTGEQSFAPIVSTRGVAKLVRFGERYRPVPPALLGELRRREGDDGNHVLENAGLAPGDRVRIVAGPFEGLEAIFQSEQGAERVRVLLELVGTTAGATLPAGFVVPVRDRWTNGSFALGVS